MENTEELDNDMELSDYDITSQDLFGTPPNLEYQELLDRQVNPSYYFLFRPNFSVIIVYFLLSFHIIHDNWTKQG